MTVQRKATPTSNAIDDRRLNPGDVAIVAPPAEIHTFIALEEGTYSVTVVGGHYAEMRHYYKPEDKTCELRKPKVVSLEHATPYRVIASKCNSPAV